MPYMREIGALMAPFDAFVMPTTPCIAPAIAEASASDEAYFRWNGRILRNTGWPIFSMAARRPCPATDRAMRPSA
jgi:Asp-tRNA(Asn)/Glu-tRNA(Gln) amidotransferase A subunit family amidase